MASKRNPPLTEFEFGDRVYVNQHFIRTWYNSEFQWKPIRCYYDNAIFLGVRILKNGYKDPHAAGSMFKISAYVQAAYVAVGSQKNPIYVPLASVTYAKQISLL